MGSGNSKEDDGRHYLLESFQDHTGDINCIAISEDHSLLATGSEDKTIRMWTTKTPTTDCIGVLKGHTSFITCLTICDTYIISGAADNTIRKWNMTTCECEVKYTGHTSRISRVVCNGTAIVSTSYDKTAKIWDFNPSLPDNEIESGCFKTFLGHTKGVYSLAYIPGDAETPEYLEEKGKKPICSPRDVLITGSADCTARSWCAETGTMLKVFKGHTGPVTCVATDPEGTLLYTGSADYTIIAWDIATGQSLREMEAHTGAVICLTVVNKLMYSGSHDNTAMCWVRENGDKIKIYKGHEASIITLKFHQGILYTGSGDTTIRAYNTKTGALMRLFTGHDAAVTCLEIVGDKLYSGSYDNTLRVWNIKNIKDESMKIYDDDIEAESNFKQDLESQLNSYETY